MNFNQNNRSDGQRGGKKFWRGDSGRRTMHKAICDKCKKECELPFKPTGDKPVFCSDCFRSKGNVRPPETRGSDFRRPSRPSFDNRQVSPSAQNTGELKEQIKMLNSKLDKILTVLNMIASEKPSASKETPERRVVAKTAPRKKVATSVKGKSISGRKKKTG